MRPSPAGCVRTAAATDVPAVDLDLSGRRSHDAREQVEQRRLPCPVRADDPDELAPRPRARHRRRCERRRCRARGHGLRESGSLPPPPPALSIAVLRPLLLLRRRRVLRPQPDERIGRELVPALLELDEEHRLQHGVVGGADLLLALRAREAPALERSSSRRRSSTPSRARGRSSEPQRSRPE